MKRGRSWPQKNREKKKNLLHIKKCMAIIKNVFIADKEKLIEKYHVKNIYLFGSFAKEIERLDSDIDLLVRFNEGNSYERKKEIMEYLNSNYTNVFKRFIDFGEISDEINDGFILENNKLIKII